VVAEFRKSSRQKFHKPDASFLFVPSKRVLVCMKTHQSTHKEMASFDDEEADDRSSQFDMPSPLESRRLDDLSPIATTTDVEAFAKANGLMHKVDLFRKASLLLQGEPAEDITDLTDTEQHALKLETDRKWQQPKMLYFTILVASLAAVEQGWAQTGINGANLYFPKAFGIGSDSPRDNLIVGFINSGIYLSSGAFGVWFSRPLNARFGRRGVIFIAAMICLIANTGSGLSGNWVILLAFRLLLGSGLGLQASTTSVYVAECAPAIIRGGLAVSWQMLTAFGIFVGFVTNASVYNVSHSCCMQALANESSSVPMCGGCSLQHH
jgi:hypothetical protein